VTLASATIYRILLCETPTGSIAGFLQKAQRFRILPATRMMNVLPTLRRELITAFALVFAGALLVAVLGFLVLYPRLESPWQATAYVFLLLLADVAIFATFGRFLIQRRILDPIERVIEGAEVIAHGDLQRRLPTGETREMQRLGDALNRMAERLIADQQQLAANIRSLDETNQSLVEARHAMVRAEKLAAAGRLAAGIAHEVGNPLGAILGYLGLIARDGKGQQLELIEAAGREAHRIDRIVRGLLDFSRPRDPKVHPLDVNIVIRETVDLIKTQGQFSEIELKLNLADGLPLVACDSYQLQQVLVNLFVNAADALHTAGVSSGCVIVQTRLRDARARPQVQARRKDDPPNVNYSHRRRLTAVPTQRDPAPPGRPVVEIIVTDNGPGIATELLDLIFEPFVTTKEPGHGTGLGLAVCARLIEGMGGVIRVENRDGAGARFNLVLPPAALTVQSTVP
jgi:signal transduction histidine kinase